MQPIAPDVVNGDLEVGGLDRHYRLFLPTRSPGEELPLVLVLHGKLGTPDVTAVQTGFDNVAEENGFLAVYPEGIGRTWNAGTCCDPARQSGVDDVGFLVALVGDLAERYDVDADRVFVSGMSNGGLMAYRLACETSGLFSAAAPVAAMLATPCDPETPVSIFHVHSRPDERVPFEGWLNLPPGTSWQDPSSVRFALGVFSDANGCVDDPTIESAPALTTEAWNDCTDSTAVKLALTDDGGHAWPGGTQLQTFLDAPSTAIDASQAIWEFFADHPQT